ncbi:MAG: hypothetical protein H7Z74_08425, partial [Anaerolineae bacterium]|nr:hypothetical protein [Gemmatimonadaceae bacterium]
VVGSGLVLAIISRSLPLLWRDALPARVRRALSESPGLFAAVIAVMALVLYCVIARYVFSARPLLIDELAQLLQARIYAGGALTRPVDVYPEFFSMLHMVDTHGTVYSQFPPGGPTMLALGELVGAPWLVGPIAGAVSALVFPLILKRFETRTGVIAGAAALFAFAPFVAYMSGSHMNHVTTLMWLMIAMAALACVITSKSPRPRVALLSGFGFAMAASIRPVDALAFALPAGIWYLSRALKDRTRWADALAAAIGVSIPMLVVMWVNTRTTGSALLFGYEVLWGKGHELGFHTPPWGDSHTPARGVELINLYMLRLQHYLFETPVPSLVPAILALALTRKLHAFDRYLLTSAGLLLGLYFAYWHDGFYLGPRFVFPLSAVLALWTARLPFLIRDRYGDGLLYRSTVYSMLVAVAMAAVFSLPVRTHQYRTGLLPLRWNADSAAAAAGVRDAIVLVRESWGSQLVARMWALGLGRPRTELLYRKVDTCLLDEAVMELERANIRGDASMAVLRPLLRDSARVVPTMLSSDHSERVLPGSTYSLHCARRIAEDSAGFTLLPPLLLARTKGIVYARDLHERDTLLLKRYTGRSVYLLKPPVAQAGAEPKFVRLSRDSLWSVWKR